MDGGYDPGKYDAVASDFATHTYADPGRYFRRRLDLLRGLGPRVEPPASVAELACGDGLFGGLLVESGFAYAGVDASPGMVEAARARLGDRVVQADFHTWEPEEPVDVTVCWNAFYYAQDRVDLLQRIRGYTRTKLVVDFIPREHPTDAVLADLRAAGFERHALRPFFVPQSYVLPAPARVVAEAAERIPPLAKLILSKRFAVVCAAW